LNILTIGIRAGFFRKYITIERRIMDKKGEFTKNGTPLFDGKNCAFRSIRMRSFLQARGFDVWKVVVNGYTTSASPPTDNAGKKIIQYNSKAINVILSGLTGSKFFKAMHCDSAKEIWDKLENVYEGDAKFKGAKLQTCRGQFEHMRMKEYEDIVAYFL
jgi:hypothetical protein